MKYLKKFEEKSQNVIYLTSESIDFGKYLFEFIKQIIDDSCSVSYNIKNVSYNVLDVFEIVETFIITVRNKLSYSTVSIALSIAKQDDDLYMRVHSSVMMSDENDITYKICEFLKKVFSEHYLLMKPNGVFYLYMNDLNTFKGEINKENFESFLDMEKYNL